jgi:hypothetical protein
MAKFTVVEDRVDWYLFDMYKIELRLVNIFFNKFFASRGLSVRSLIFLTF